MTLLKPSPDAGFRIQLGKMPQLAEAVDRDDDWTGLTDAASRRKRQNRLNARAFRRRKAREAHLKEVGVDVSDKDVSPATTTDEGADIACWSEDKQALVYLPRAVAQTLHNTRSPILPTLTSREKSNGIIFPLSSDHLIALLQYNTLRGSLANRELISCILPSSPTSECSSAALHVLPDTQAVLPDSLPPSLYPTTLQSTIPHEEWLDIIPHPVLRDNLLNALGTFDEDELWSDTIGGLFEGFPASEIECRGIVIWSPPWHTSGWEVTEGFWRKWGWLLAGCSDMLVATNHWRSKRGEPPLVFEV